MEFVEMLHRLSAKSVVKRLVAVTAMRRRVENGCWISRLALEYILEHDPNSAVRNRASLVFKRSNTAPRDGVWENHFSF